VSNGVSRPKSEEIFGQLCLAKGEIANLIAHDLGYIGVPRYEHIQAASLMIEARMLALTNNPSFLTTKTPIEMAVQRYVDLNQEYSVAVATVD
jgi:hypothetical protein